MSKEKQLLTELLLMYRDFSYLWDNKQVLYLNREAREKAYEVLLEKYKQIHEDAAIHDVKKKIDHMRTNYRRERKRVLLSKLNGDVDEYVPQLWYYDLFCFLNDVSDFSKLEAVPRGDETMSSIKEEYNESTPRKKKRKVSTVYLPDSIEGRENDSIEYYDNAEDNDSETSVHDNGEHGHINVGVSEPEAFGTTVGLQLKELDPMQRIVAEKLISDVIYNGRLQRLSVGSFVAVNYDSL